MKKYTKKLEDALPSIMKTFKGVEGVSVYAMVYSNMSFDRVDNTACHASMSNWELIRRRINMAGNNHKLPVAYIVNSLRPRADRVTEEIEREYLEWLMNDSVFAKSFVTKDIDRALKDRCVVNTTAYHKDFTTAAVVSIRGVSEYGQIAKTWFKLTKSGVDPHVAWCLGHSLSYRGGKYIFNPCNEHTSYRGSYSVDVLVKFMKAIESFDFERDTYAENQKYSRISAWFDDTVDGNRDFGKTMNDLVRRLKIGEKDKSYKRVFDSPHLSFNQYYLNNNNNEGLKVGIDADVALAVSNEILKLAYDEEQEKLHA